MYSLLFFCNVKMSITSCFAQKLTDFAIFFGRPAPSLFPPCFFNNSLIIFKFVKPKGVDMSKCFWSTPRSFISSKISLL